MSDPGMLPVLDSFAALLRRHRLAAGLSQEALAERAGLSARAVSALERGVNRQPRLETVQLLATALALSPEQRAAFLAAARPGTHPAPPHPAPPPGTPAGTLTFLLTDVEGSTALWERHEAAMRAALVRLDALLDGVLVQHGGRRIRERGEGDAIFAVFADPAAAVAAALAIQQALLAEPWPEQITLRLRMALHTGIALLHREDYYGPIVNRAARIRDLGHGGQVLLAEATAALVGECLPAGATLREPVLHSLPGIDTPQRIYQLFHPTLPEDFAPLRAPQPALHNLPEALSSLVGREEEQSEVLALLGDCRLVTLVGTGGVGKTRMALAVAGELLAAYPDGVWLVELAGLGTGTLVPGAVAGVLGVREESGRDLAAALINYLREKRLLLVLDNCEHLVDACAGLVEGMLRACAGLRVLATSREGLGVVGERLYRVPSLPVPDPVHLPPLAELGQVAAVRLFLERADARAAGFALTTENAPAVAGICRRLEGIPLALELAAGRVGSLPLEVIAARLDQSLRLLTGGARTAPSRQQTLRGALDWSWGLLGATERVLLRRLAVFAGSWTLGAAEAVCAGPFWGGGRPGDAEGGSPSERGDVLVEWEVADLLASVASKSLALLEDRAGTEGRYRLLEPVRHYAHEQSAAAGEEEAVRGRHLAWAVALAEEAAPQLVGSEQGVWLERLEAEHDNLRAALAWSLRGDAAGKGIQLAGALWRFWEMHGHLGEGRRWLSEALAPMPQLGTPSASTGDAAAAPPALRARALNGAGNLAHRQGDYAQAQALHEECLALQRRLGNGLGIANSLTNLGNATYFRGDYTRARVLYAESLARFRDLDHTLGIGAALSGLGNVAYWQGDYAEARALYAEGLALSRELGDGQGIAASLISLGNVAERQGDNARAGACYAESLALARELGDKQSIANSLTNLGNVAYAQGDYAGARALFAECATISRELGEMFLIADALEGFALLAGALGQEQRGARLWGATDALRRALGAPRLPDEQAEYDRAIVMLREALGEEAFAGAWAAGQAVPLEEAIALALARDGAG